MRTIRIHVEQSLAIGGELTLPAPAGEHVARVLRLAAGDAITLFNGNGYDYPAIILAVTKREVTAQIQSMLTLDNESPLLLTLAQGVARGEKMDLIVQKATELGVARMVPLLTERTDVKLDADRAEKRLAHWRAVAISACEQSGRARVPVIAPVMLLDDWLQGLPPHGSAQDDARRLALLPAGELRIGALTFTCAGGLVVAGPEGGLGGGDIAQLTQAGFSGLRLGPRILRTETAGLAALAALQAMYGDF